jgi:MFS family permease
VVVPERSETERAVRAAIGVSQVINGANLSAVTVAFADLSRSFPGQSLAAISWVLTAYTIVYAATLVPLGRLADRIGRARVFQWGLATFAIGCVLASASPWLWAVVASRVVQAVGGAMILPGAMGLLLDVTPRERRTQANAYAAMTASAGNAVGPVLGGVFVELAGWRSVLAIPALLCVLCWWLGRGRLPADVPVERGPDPDLFGSVLFVAAVSLLILGVVEADRWGWTSAEVVGCLSGTVVLSAIVFRRCIRHPMPVLPLRLLRQRTMGLSTLSIFLYGFAAGAQTFVNVQLLIVVWDYSVLSAGLAQCISAGAAVAGATWAGRAARRVGEVRVGAACGAVAAASAVVASVVLGVESGFWTRWAPCVAVLFFASSAWFAMIISMCLRATPPAELSVASATVRTAFQVGTAVGIAVVIVVLGSLEGASSIGQFRDTYVFIGVMCALATAVFAVSGPRRPVAVS